MATLKEEEKKKIERKYHKVFNWACTAFIPTLLGLFIMGKEMTFSNYKFEQKYKTPVVEQHIATGKTLSSLEWDLKDVDKDLKKIDLLSLEARNYISEGISALEKTIITLRKYGVEMAENPQVKEYYKQKEVFEERSRKNKLYGLLMFIAGIATFGGIGYKYSKPYSKEMEELERKYPSKESR